MSDNDLIIYEEETNHINGLLSKMLKGCEAKCALLVDKDGHLITRQGFTHSLDTTALAALLAGSFASTKEIARLRNRHAAPVDPVESALKAIDATSVPGGKSA